jgi:hypothetical protein
VLLWLVSSLEIRFAARHRRDDYRDAAQAAHTALAGGERVWWVAAGYAAEYYGIALPTDPKAGTVVAPLYLATHDLASLPPPNVVILSKPWLFDRTGVMATYLQVHHYRLSETLPAFTVWEK